MNSNTIEITPTSKPGVFEFHPPFRHDEFIDEFKRKVGKSFRVWHVWRETWQVRPLDDGHLKYMADILEKHFERPVVIVDPVPAGPEMPGDYAAICDCCGSYPETEGR